MDGLLHVSCSPLGFRFDSRMFPEYYDLTTIGPSTIWVLWSKKTFSIPCTSGIQTPSMDTWWPRSYPSWQSWHRSKVWPTERNYCRSCNKNGRIMESWSGGCSASFSTSIGSTLRSIHWHRWQSKGTRYSRLLFFNPWLTISPRLSCLP